MKHLVWACCYKYIDEIQSRKSILSLIRHPNNAEWFIILWGKNCFILSCYDCKVNSRIMLHTWVCAFAHTRLAIIARYYCIVLSQVFWQVPVRDHPHCAKAVFSLRWKSKESYCWSKHSHTVHQAHQVWLTTKQLWMWPMVPSGNQGHLCLLVVWHLMSEELIGNAHTHLKH